MSWKIRRGKASRRVFHVRSRPSGLAAGGRASAPASGEKVYDEGQALRTLRRARRDRGAGAGEHAPNRLFEVRGEERVRVVDV